MYSNRFFPQTFGRTVTSKILYGVLKYKIIKITLIICLLFPQSTFSKICTLKRLFSPTSTFTYIQAQWITLHLLPPSLPNLFLNRIHFYKVVRALKSYEWYQFYYKVTLLNNKTYWDFKKHIFCNIWQLLVFLILKRKVWQKHTKPTTNVSVSYIAHHFCLCAHARACTCVCVWVLSLTYM